MHEVEGFDKRDHSLHPASLASWHGFLFLNLSSTPPPLEEALAPLQGRFDRFQLSALARVRRIDYEVGANWKLIFQNYNECLHCPTIHPHFPACCRTRAALTIWSRGRTSVGTC